MADDYLSDREQEEALRNWWRENWRWIMAGIALGLGGLGGWQYWRVHQTQQAEQAASLYGDFQSALKDEQVEQAAGRLDELVRSHEKSAYTQQARLLLAKSHVDAGKYDEAVALLNAAAGASRDAELAHVARLRAARVLIEQKKADEALAVLKVKDAGAFAAQVREVRGDALVAKGDSEAARAEYAAALASSDDPQIDRTMLELKLAELGGSAPEKAAPETEVVSP